MKNLLHFSLKGNSTTKEGKVSRYLKVFLVFLHVFLFYYKYQTLQVKRCNLFKRYETLFNIERFMHMF